MKHLPRILGLTFLAFTLTNCSLSSEQIASRLERSIVKLSYRKQPGHGTGFFVRGEKGVCTVLTAAHVVKKEGQILLQTNKNRELKQIDKVEIFPGTIDLAVVTFPVEEKCNYPALKIGNSHNLKKGSSIYISGFPDRGGIVVDQFVEGKVSGLNKLAQGYGVSYQALTVGGMSGAPVVDVKGEVVAVHGMSDVEVVQNFAALQGSLSESERQTFQQAVARVNGVQRLTFSWGIPISWFRESDFYYADVSGWILWLLFGSGVMFGGGVVYFGLRNFQTPQVSGERYRELSRLLKDEQRRRREVEGRLNSVQNNKSQREKELSKQLQQVEGRLNSVQNTRSQKERELEGQLKDEEGRRREVEGRLNSVQNNYRELSRQLEYERQNRQGVEVQGQGEVRSRQGKSRSSVDVPLVSAKGVDYTRLRDLLAGENGRRRMEKQQE